MDFLENLKENEKRDFKRIANKLFSNCFICKKTERHEYRFIRRNKELFKTYFDVCGYRLEENEENGIFQLVNYEGHNRKQFNINESIILLILRIIYDEKRRELSMISEAVTNIGEIQDMYEAVRDGKKITKTDLRNALNTMRRYSIIEVENLTDLFSGDAVPIIILDTITMAVPIQNIRETYEMLDKYRKNGSEMNIAEMVE